MRRLYLALIIGILLIGIVLAGTLTSIIIDKSTKDILDKTYTDYPLINQTCQDGYCTGLLVFDDGKGNIEYSRVNFKDGDISGMNEVIIIKLQQKADDITIPKSIKITKPDEDITLTAKIK